MRRSQKVIMAVIVSVLFRAWIQSNSVCCGIQCFHGGNELHPLLALHWIHIPGSRRTKGVEPRKTDAHPGRRNAMVHRAG